jgi:hypothetical protein
MPFKPFSYEITQDLDVGRSRPSFSFLGKKLIALLKAIKEVFL